MPKQCVGILVTLLGYFLCGVSAFSAHNPAVVRDFVKAADNSTVFGTAFDSHGNIFYADFYKGIIRKVSSSLEQDILFAGGGTIEVLPCRGSACRFHGPMTLVMDSKDNIFVTCFFT